MYSGPSNYWVTAELFQRGFYDRQWILRLSIQSLELNLAQIGRLAYLTGFIGPQRIHTEDDTRIVWVLQQALPQPPPSSLTGYSDDAESTPADRYILVDSGAAYNYISPSDLRAASRPQQTYGLAASARPYQDDSL